MRLLQVGSLIGTANFVRSIMNDVSVESQFGGLKVDKVSLTMGGRCEI